VCDILTALRLETSDARAGGATGEGGWRRRRGGESVGGAYVPLLWLLAVLSLVGWFIWNGDLAGWILLALVIGLMCGS